MQARPTFRSLYSTTLPAFDTRESRPEGTELQRLIGGAMKHHGNDRDGYEKGQKALERAHEQCFEARSFDPPTG